MPGSAAAMNAAIKRNAALRKGRNNIFDRKAEYQREYANSETPKRICSSATRLRNREKFRSARAKDIRREIMIYTLGVTVALFLGWYFFGDYIQTLF